MIVALVFTPLALLLAAEGADATIPASPPPIATPSAVPPAALVAAPAREPPRITWAVPIAHATGMLVGMRLALSLTWKNTYNPFPLNRSARQFADAYTMPPEYHGSRGLLESDNDPWVVNVFGHGLFGSEIYGRTRQCGGGPWQSLAFAVGTSAFWEYGVESFSKRPSALDLVATPLIGAALGEGRLQVQRWLRTRPRGFWRSFGEIVIDPIGEGERGLVHTRC